MRPVVWLVGGRGMLGQAVAKKLHAAGARYQSTGREVDIAVPAAVQAYAESEAFTHIINCAAYTQVDACETQGAQAHGANALGPVHLAAAARKLGVPVMHVSTDYVFSGAASTPYTETDACAPLGMYGQTKYAGEVGFWAALAAPTEAMAPAPSGYVVRTSWLFGHGGRHFVTTMLRLMQQKKQLGVVADQFGRPTFCDDLAAAMVQLLGLGKHLGAPAPAGTYHFANTGAVSWHGFALGILGQARAFGRPLTCQVIQAIGTQDYPTPARRPAYSVLCTDKIAQVLGQAPRSWETALEAYLAAHTEDVADAAGFQRATPTPGARPPISTSCP